MGTTSLAIAAIVLVVVGAVILIANIMRNKRVSVLSSCACRAITDAPPKLWSNSGFMPPLEEFVAPNHLGVAAVPHFDPGRIAIFDDVPAQAVLADNAFQITLADEFEQLLTFALNVVDEHQEG